MNLAVLCQGCGSMFRVLGTDDSSSVSLLVGENSEFWPDKYTCPSCGGNAVGYHEESLPRAFQTIAIIDLSAEELFSALHGLGLPNEGAPSAKVVTHLLLTEKIASVVVRDIPNTGRCAVDSITFASGMRLNLAASAQGAVVYRVVHAPSYAARILQEQT